MGFVDDLDSVAKSSKQWNAEREKAIEGFIQKTVEDIKYEIKRKVESGTFDANPGLREVSYRFTMLAPKSIEVYSNGKKISIVLIEKRIKKTLLAEKLSMAFTPEGIEIIRKIQQVLEEDSITSIIGVHDFLHGMYTSNGKPINKDIIPFDINSVLPFYQDHQITFFLDCKVVF